VIAAALVATGFAYQPERRAAQGRRVAGLLPRIRDIRRFGSAALDLCYVAAGRFDAYYEQWLNPWDRAAGELIAAEAGARSGTFPGGEGEPAGLVVAAPGVFDDLLALL
jgi:myo-inositol-1(or 4)-monophosphatase